MGRPYICEDCGTAGIQSGGGKAQKRCDRCRAGHGGNTPRKSDVQRPAGSAPAAVEHSPRRQHQTIREAVEADLDALMTPHPMAEGLRELALFLADSVDTCEEKHTAAMARELRATLDSLASYRTGGDDEADGDIDLSAEILDPPQP